LSRDAYEVFWREDKNTRLGYGFPHNSPNRLVRPQLYL
jgi:hypothetical protein